MRYANALLFSLARAEAYESHEVLGGCVRTPWKPESDAPRFCTSFFLSWLARCELEETGTSGSSSETPSQVTVSALANFLTRRIVSTPLSLRMLVHHTEGARESRLREDRARGTRDPARSASPPDRGPENVPAYYRLPRVSKNYRLTYFTNETTQRAKIFASRDRTSTFTSVLAAKSTIFGWPSLRQDQVAPDLSPAQLVLGA